MNLTLIFHRLEIVFWTAWVAALQNPRARRLAPSGLLLIPGVLLIALLSAWLRPDAPAPSRSLHVLAASTAALDSLTASPYGQMTLTASPYGQSAYPAPAATGPTARPANGQENLLLLVVDSLEAASPELHGVWLLARMPALAQVTFLPIYPSTEPAGQSFDARLEAAFLPTKREPLPVEFRQALQAQGLWWDHYLVMDEAGLAELLDLAGSFNRETGAAALAVEPATPAAGPQAALTYQSSVAREVCANSTRWSVGSAPVVVATLFAQSAVSDLDAEDLRHTLRSLRATDGIACQFPILTGR